MVVTFVEFVISVKGSHYDYLSQMPKNPAMPLDWTGYCDF